MGRNRDPPHGAHGGPCAGCGYMFPPGADTCLVCGHVEPHRGDPYPAARIERYAWVEAQWIGDATAKNILKVLVHRDMPGGDTPPGTVRLSYRRLMLAAELGKTALANALKFLAKKERPWIVVRHQHKAHGRRAPSLYVIQHPDTGVQSSEFGPARVRNPN